MNLKWPFIPTLREGKRKVDMVRSEKKSGHIEKGKEKWTLVWKGKVGACFCVGLCFCILTHHSVHSIFTHLLTNFVCRTRKIDFGVG